MLPGEVEILAPETREVRGSRLAVTLVVLVVAAVASVLVRPGSSPELFVADLAAKAIAVMAACALGAWVEQRAYTASVGQGAMRQLTLGVVTPLLSLAVGAALFYAAVAAGPFVRDDGTLMLIAAAGTLWIVSASVGSLVALLLEVVLRAVVPNFRVRIKLALLGLTLLGAGISVALYQLVRRLPQLLPALDPGRLRGYIESRGAFSEDVTGLVASLSVPQRVLATAAAAMLLVLLPAALSACGKLADAAVERLSPLVEAFSAVGQGRLDVLLEEGGSKEFVALSRGFNDMVEKLALAQRKKRIFSNYAGRGIVASAANQLGDAVPQPAQGEATVLFVDVRGLLTLTQVLPPAQTLELINRFLGLTLEVVDRYNGYFDKLMGDAVLVAFNAPVDQFDHPERATRCAIHLQKEIVAMNRAGRFSEFGPVSIGIGIATGPLVSGFVGVGERAVYTILGDTVHLASRLASLTPPGQVWVNQAAADRLPEDLPTLLLAAPSGMGRALPVVPYRVWPPP